MRIFTKEQIAKINKKALGDKHGCSGEYVGQVLIGHKTTSTKAKLIIQDAIKLLSVLENQPKSPVNV